MSNYEESALLSVDAYEGCGGLVIKLPANLQKNLLKDQQTLKIAIDFLVHDPKSGLKFNTPSLMTKNNSIFDSYCVLFTSDYNSSSWFPCLFAYNEPHTWKIEITVPKIFDVIASGELIEKKLSDDLKHLTYHYFLSIPTVAPKIGLVIGQFECIQDENMSEINSYCLQGVTSLLKNCTSFIHEVFEFYEDYLSTQYPYSNYKQIFIDNTTEEYISFASITIFNISLLHPNSIIEQCFLSRRLIACAVAEQLFGCFIVPQTLNDWWLVSGICAFISSLYFKKIFGNNECRFNLNEDMKEICSYERENGYIMLDFSGDSKENSKAQFFIRNFSMISSSYRQIARKKAHLVVRLIEDTLGVEVMTQMLNKILSLGVNASLQKYASNIWAPICLSVESFQRLLGSVTSKEIKPILEQWVQRHGFIRFNSSYSFNRKKNVIELELKQESTTQKGFRKYNGPLVIVMQELDGSFTHTIQVDENTLKYDLSTHSKLRRNKKKKIPLACGEEVDIEINQGEVESPVLWLRIDPDLKLIREVKLEQSDFSWQNELKYEKDILAQLDATDALIRFQSVQTRSVLTSVIEHSDMYYQVRIAASFALAEVANKMVHTWNGPLALLPSFKKLYMSQVCANMIRPNNFIDPTQYFIQKHLPIAIATLRNIHNVCPNEVVRFILDLIRFNENSKNKYSDCYYRASLIDALNETISSTAIASNIDDHFTSKALTPELRAVIEEIVLRLNLEKLNPTYHHVITSSCLKALRTLMKYGHIPENIEIFKQYAQIGTYEDVRKTAFDIIVSFLEGSFHTF